MNIECKKNKERFVVILDSISAEIHTCAVPILRSILHRQYSQHRDNTYETYATALQKITFTHDHVATYCRLESHLNNSHLMQFQIITNKMQRFLIQFYKCSACFRRFLCPSSGAQNCTYSFRYCQSVLLLAASVNEMEFHLIHASSQQQYWLTIPEAVCTIFVLVMMGQGTA